MLDPISIALLILTVIAVLYVTDTAGVKDKIDGFLKKSKKADADSDADADADADSAGFGPKSFHLAHTDGGLMPYGSNVPMPGQDSLRSSCKPASYMSVTSSKPLSDQEMDLIRRGYQMGKESCGK